MVKPVAVIDSGLGGLAIAEAIRKKLPQQAMIYLADHEFFPYGNKTAAVINRRLIRIVDWLISKNCQLVVIACNTITASAIDFLRQRYQIPFVGTEPAVKLGGLVLATPTTASSYRYRQLARQYPVTTIGCPGLAEAIEHGRLLKPRLPRLPATTKTVVLGCTHYILVKEQIQKIYGRKIKIIDPSEAIANQAVKILISPQPGPRQFYTTGSALKATKRTSRLLEQSIIFKSCSL